MEISLPFNRRLYDKKFKEKLKKIGGSIRKIMVSSSSCIVLERKADIFLTELI